MNSNHEICITTYKIIIEHVALLYNGILLFCAQGLLWRQNDNFELLRQQYELYNVCKYFLHISRAEYVDFYINLYVR